MTAAAIVPTPGQGFLKATVKGFVCLMAVILTLSVPVALFVWQFFDFQNENALSQEWFRVWGKVFGGYVAGVATLFVVSQMFWRLLENAFAFFRKKTWIGPYSLVWILLSVAPLTNFWHIVNQPYLLHTNEGQVRLMDDGRVFYAGSAVEVPRFSISSTTVPLDIFAEGDYSGNWNPAPVFADTPSGRIYLVHLGVRS